MKVARVDSASRLRVAIVEDSEIIVSRLKQMFSSIGSVELAGEAKSVRTAFQLVSSEQPDVVVLDIQLQDAVPSMNGITLLAMVKLNFPHIKVIMLTNSSEEIYKNRCTALGVNYFFDKSNEFEKVPDAIIEIINAKHYQS